MSKKKTDPEKALTEHIAALDRALTTLDGLEPGLERERFRLELLRERLAAGLARYGGLLDRIEALEAAVGGMMEPPEPEQQRAASSDGGYAVQAFTGRIPGMGG